MWALRQISELRRGYAGCRFVFSLALTQLLLPNRSRARARVCVFAFCFVSYGAEYTDTTMGAAVPGIIEALMGNVGLETAVDNAMSDVGAAAERAGLKALSEIPGLAGAVEAAEMFNCRRP